MDRFDRIYELHRLLAGHRYPISKKTLIERLECSDSTVKRTIDDMNTYLGASIEFDRKRNGYHYKLNEASYEIPGLWFNSDELFALLTSHRLLAGIQPGFLEEYLGPFRKRIETLLAGQKTSHAELDKRIRILQTSTRPTNLNHFRKVTTALLKRKKLKILYHGRERDETTERTISPQRLIYYRDNWYLDAWCHLREGLRSFSLDRLEPRVIEDVVALDCAEKQLDDHYTGAYGIFAGSVEEQAHLRFSQQAAKWVADEQWHPRQQDKALPNGEFELWVPYGNPTELIREILKYGAEVEVLGPQSLREAVMRAHREALAVYEK